MNAVRLVSVLALACLGLGFSAPPDSLLAHLPPGRHVISRATIQQVGITRLVGLFDLASGWTSFAIDDWQRHARPPGAAPFQARTWQVWIDGQRIPTVGPAPQSFNALPVAMDDLAYVEVIEGPAWHEGAFVPYGALHLHTRSAGDAASFQASYWVGNEIGDAGPLRYVHPDIPNVDHHGPDITATGRYGAAQIRGRATALSRSNIPTNPAQRRRITAWTPYFPERDFLGGAVQGRLRTENSHHRVRLSGSSLRDFVFWEPIAREIPLRRSQFRIGTNGSRAMTQESQLAYRASYERQMLTAVTGSPVGLEARPWQLSTHGRWIHAGASTETTLTGNVEWVKYPLLHHSTRRVGIGARLTRNMYGLRPTVAGSVSREAGRFYVNGLAHVRRQLGGALAVTAKLAWMERPFRAQRPLAYAARHGLAFTDTLSAFAEQQEHRVTPTARTLHVGGRLQWKRERMQSLSARFFVRRQHGLAVLRRSRLAYDPTEKAFSGAMLLRKGAGSVAGAQLRSRWQWKGWQQETSLLAQGALSGDAVYRAAWRSAPRWQIRSRWQWTLNPRFLLAAQLRGQSGTEWASYAEAARLSAGVYQGATPSSWSVDLSAQKRFWGDHLRVKLRLRNVLNQEVRTHPLGASSVLMLALKASLRLHTSR